MNNSEVYLHQSIFVIYHADVCDPSWQLLRYDINSFFMDIFVL